MSESSRRKSEVFKAFLPKEKITGHLTGISRPDEKDKQPMRKKELLKGGETYEHVTMSGGTKSNNESKAGWFP